MAGKGVGTVNIINLDNDLNSNAPGPREVRRTKVVPNRQLRVLLNANGHTAGPKRHITIRRPVRRWREPEGRPIEKDCRPDVIDEQLEPQTEQLHLATAA